MYLYILDAILDASWFLKFFPWLHDFKNEEKPIFKAFSVQTGLTVLGEVWENPMVNCAFH